MNQYNNSIYSHNMYSDKNFMKDSIVQENFL